MVCLLKPFSIDMEIPNAHKMGKQKVWVSVPIESQGNDSWLEAGGGQVSFHLWMVYDGNKDESV